MRTLHLVCLCLAVFAMLLSHPALAEQPAPTALYRKELSEGREVVLIQGPMVPVSAVKDLLSPGLVNHPANPAVGVFSLTLELHFRSGPLLRLWSRVLPIYRDSEYGQYAVLDLLVLPGRQILVMATPGSSIDVWEVALHAPDRVARLRYADWSQLAASIPTRPGRLSAKLSYNDQDGLVEVEVTDFLERTRQHTLFQQGQAQWQFGRVKQWRQEVNQGVPE